MIFSCLEARVNSRAAYVFGHLLLFYFYQNRVGAILKKRDGCLKVNRIEERGETMLVLSRRKNESIIIGDDVEITIVDICGGKVRLGINAPKDVSVHREEV